MSVLGSADDEEALCTVHRFNAIMASKEDFDHAPFTRAIYTFPAALIPTHLQIRAGPSPFLGRSLSGVRQARTKGKPEHLLQLPRGSIKSIGKVYTAFRHTFMTERDLVRNIDVLSLPTEPCCKLE